MVDSLSIGLLIEDGSDRINHPNIANDSTINDRESIMV
jgi:hypothetical protein